MAALVAALVVQTTDRAAWLTAILADRYHRPAIIIVAAAAAFTIGYGIAAELGALIAPRLTPETKQLFLALALASAGISAFFPIKPPRRLETWRLGGFATALVGVLVLAAGDRAQFIVITLAARSEVPVLAAIGALIGTMIVIVPATLAGEAARDRLPFLAVRVATGGLLTLIGVVVGLSAVGLI